MSAMWLLGFLFVSISAVVAWTMFGYFLLIWVIGLFRDERSLSRPAEWPRLLIVVPCWQEEQYILAKLDDLRRQTYPRERLRVLFVDGGSTDRTVELLQGAILPEEPFEVMHAPRGKILQLNAALARSDIAADLVVNTDVDARLAPDALEWLAAELCAAPDAGVAGAFSQPADAIPIDSYWWVAQNKGRLMEMNAGSSSIVIAQCYAFRRELLRAFPEDVVADDVYVAFLCNTLGLRTVYSTRAHACELRGPQSLRAFMPHKFRKSNAFLRESLRFLYRLPEMEPLVKVQFLTRLAQQLFLSWCLLAWVLVAGVLVTLGRQDIVLIGLGGLVGLLMWTSLVFGRTKLPFGPQRFSLLVTARGFALTTLIMLFTALSYPFYRQRSSYSRLATAGPADAAGVLPPPVVEAGATDAAQV